MRQQSRGSLVFLVICLESYIIQSVLIFGVSNIYAGEEVAEEWLKDDGHVGILNVWRPTVRAVEKSPLGFLDVNSVDCTVR